MNCLNMANITSRFALYTGISRDEVYNWRSLIDDAISYIGSVLTKEVLTENDRRRIEALCAVYACKLYNTCSNDGINSFSVGGVRVTSSADSRKSADALWKTYASGAQDLIGNEKFLFGRM